MPGYWKWAPKIIVGLHTAIAIMLNSFYSYEIFPQLPYIISKIKLSKLTNCSSETPCLARFDIREQLHSRRVVNVRVRARRSCWTRRIEDAACWYANCRYWGSMVTRKQPPLHHKNTSIDVSALFLFYVTLTSDRVLKLRTLCVKVLRSILWKAWMWFRP